MLSSKILLSLLLNILQGMQEHITPLQTFSEYWKALQEVAKDGAKLKMMGLTETELKEHKELIARCLKYEEDHTQK